MRGRHLFSMSRRRFSVRRLPLLMLAAGLPLGLQAQTAASAAAEEAAEAPASLGRVLISGHASGVEAGAGESLAPRLLARRRAGTSDVARLLEGLPGVSLAGAGGVSSLPALNGLGGDRVRTQVDGMDLVAACPNHMNSPLSYLDPSQVGSVRVYAGIAPVSLGGDSLGGTIQVQAPEPEFAAPDQPWLSQGRLSGQWRGAGRERGAQLGASLAAEHWVLAYRAASTRRENYRAARDFKPETPGTEGGPPLPGDEVGSSAYRARNQELSLALRHEQHLLLLKAGRQELGFEGFPNQRMDMTSNRSTQLSLRYSLRFEGGELLARLYQQKVAHKMDMGPDRYRYGYGMPMDTEATTRGGLLQATLALGEAARLRLGAESQSYVLYDWWPAVGGSMGPNAFWNVDDGQRHKRGLFAELEAPLSERWSYQLGLRADRVTTDAGPVQGYDNGLGAIWGHEAAAFNALPRRRSDGLLDAVALLWFQPEPGLLYEIGWARKNRAPSLYQRYPWSTQPMAALMNNFLGDGNGYIGRPDLRPERASTLSLAAQWQDASDPVWSLRAAAHHSEIHDYIDARRCDFGQCGAANPGLREGFVLLQYENQRARIRGLDLQARWRFAESAAWGRLTAGAQLKQLQGRNTARGDGLYNLQPAQLTLSLEQQRGPWQLSAEWVGSAAKRRVSAVRNEMPTAGYALLHLRGAYELGAWRLDFGVENLFNRFHNPALGGAYLGQGRSMTSAGIPWGTPVPGPGRSAYAALAYSFL